MTAVSTDVAIGTPPPAPPSRPRVLIIGTSFVVTAILLGFAALIALYIQQRAAAISNGGVWIPKESDIPTTPGTMMLITLGMSTVTMQWAVWSITRDDRPRTYMALGVTALLGLAYINGIAFFFTQTHLSVTEPIGLLVFTLFGAHLAMVGAGVLFLGLMAFRTLGGQYSSRDREGISAAAIYWYATVAVYCGLWLLVFIKK
jgi:heme/copper-type cytochrome/quinol oxidase subunit 3